jgi:hypothetical protein
MIKLTNTFIHKYYLESMFLFVGMQRPVSVSTAYPTLTKYSDQKEAAMPGDRVLH